VKSGNNWQSKAMTALTYAFAVCVCVAISFPLYWMFKTSLQKASDFFQSGVQLLVRQFEYVNYLSVFRDYNMGRWLVNSALITVATTALTVPTSLFAAYSLSRFRYFLRIPFIYLILLTQMLPATLLILPLFTIFRTMGLLDSLRGLVLANVTFSLPLSIAIMKGFLDTVPREIEEAAMIDGCGRVKIIRRIIVPIALPGLITISVIAFFLTWDEFLFATTFINDASKWVGTVGLSSFRGIFITPWNEILAAACIYSIPALLFYFGGQRYIVQGLTAGSIKG
jgi:multiple sugar transport system permease protein